MSDNVERRQMVRAAVARAQSEGEEVTVENVARYLPGGSKPIKQFTGEGYEEPFGLDADDLLGWLPQNVMIDSTPDGRALIPSQSIPAVELETTADPSVTVEDDSLRHVWPPESVSVEVVEQKPAPTQYELGELRIILARAKDRQTTARSKFSIARDRFLRAVGTQGPTHDELMRQHARESNQYLADIKSGKVQRPVYSRIGASVVDHMAAAMRGSGQRAGGGRSYSRGAYPSSMRGRKLPSEG
jgi:hypothetical protein